MSENQNRVLLAVRDNIAYVTLNRPEKHNGLDMPMFDAIIDTARQIRADRSIRAAVVVGEGESFCAGLDFKAISKDKWAVPKLFFKWPWGKTNKAQRVAQCWRDLPIPVIAALHGNCFGGGLQIALACDFRFAAADTQLSVMEMKWGLIPDMSGTVALSRLTRLDVAQELTMTGRQFSGREAADYGLVTRVVDQPMQAATELAQSLAEKSPDAVAATKALFKKTWQAEEGKALRWERWTQARIIGRKNNRIAMANGLAGKDKAKKPFIDRSSFR